MLLSLQDWDEHLAATGWDGDRIDDLLRTAAGEAAVRTVGPVNIRIDIHRNTPRPLDPFLEGLLPQPCKTFSLKVLVVATVRAETLAAVRTFVGDAEVGEILEVGAWPDHGLDPLISALFGERLPFWNFADYFEVALSKRLPHLEAVSYPAGTLGALLAQGGGWLRGLVVDRNGTRTELAAINLYCYSIRPGQRGFCLEVCLRSHANGKSHERWLVMKELNADALDLVFTFPTSLERRDDVCLQLAQLALNQDDHRALNAALFWAAVPIDSAGSRWHWFKRKGIQHLQGALASWRLERDGATLSIEVGEARIAESGGYPGGVSIAIELCARRGQQELWRIELDLHQGRLQPSSCIAPPPESDGIVESLSQRYTQLLTRWMQAALTQHGVDGLELNPRAGIPAARLVETLERHWREGLSEPPSQTRSANAIESVAAKVAKVSPQVAEQLRAQRRNATAGYLAAYQIGGWIIELADATKGWPHGAAEITLIEGSERIRILATDVWSPSHRSIDGDALRMRCLLHALTLAIAQNNLDETVFFSADGNGPTEQHAFTISRWLMFAFPSFEEDFVLHWREDNFPTPWDVRLGDWEILGISLETREFLNGRGSDRYHAFLEYFLGDGDDTTAG